MRNSVLFASQHSPFARAPKSKSNSKLGLEENYCNTWFDTLSSSTERVVEVALMRETMASPVMLFESRMSSRIESLLRRQSEIIDPTVSVMPQLARLTFVTCELLPRALKSFSHLAV